MKKNLLLLIFLTMGMSILAQNEPLQTEADSVSYAAGVDLAHLLSNQLVREGVLGDTTAVRISYRTKISQEKNKTKKEALNNELNSKLDSLTVVNNNILSDYIKGYIAATNAKNTSQLAYASGYMTGSRVMQTMIPDLQSKILAKGQVVNKNALNDGLVAVLNNQPLAIQNSEMYLKAEAKKKNPSADRSIKMNQQDISNLTAGTKFLDENKLKKGVITLPDGLQYKVLVQGKGARPKATDTVVFNYTGRTINGVVFDSSLPKNKPLEIEVNKLIRAWAEALELMPVGSRWLIYVPYQLALRKDSPINYSTMIFDLDLLAIKKM